jgi:hypothetical protein
MELTPEFSPRPHLFVKGDGEDWLAALTTGRTRGAIP